MIGEVIWLDLCDLYLSLCNHHGMMLYVHIIMKDNLGIVSQNLWFSLFALWPWCCCQHMFGLLVISSLFCQLWKLKGHYFWYSTCRMVDAFFFKSNEFFQSFKISFVFLSMSCQCVYCLCFSGSSQRQNSSVDVFHRVKVLWNRLEVLLALEWPFY